MKKIFFVIPAILLISCSEEPKQEKEISSAPVIADSLFALHNIRSTQELPSIWYDENDHFQPYTDSTKKTKLVKMDSVMKKQILVPILDIDPSYVVQYMDAVYISKQDSIGPYTPVIVNLSGDDYDELFLILLDAQCKPVSKLSLRGGEWSGPDETDENGLLHYAPSRESFFSHDTINASELHITENSSSGILIIDSLSFRTTIGTNGQFNTIRKDSVRYERKTQPFRPFRGNVF